MIELVLLLAPIAPLPPQEADPLEGHSGHGQAFNEGPRQSAYLLDNPDSVHFPVTVATDELQRFFDQGVGHLHGFWYLEAERSFRHVAAADPDCAMAYWGLAMANVSNDERAAQFARIAWLKRGLVTEREQLYIDALARFWGVEGPDEPSEPDAVDEPDEEADAGADEGDAEAWYDDGEDEVEPRTRAQKEAAEKAAEEERELRRERAQQLVEDYETIVWEYPDDIEAKAFLANRLWMNQRYGLPISSRHANEALLQQVFAREPMHPAHHYRIHLWDRPEWAERVVDSAVNSGPSWATIAHMWHMGGHIFARLGRHADAAWQQEASARVDHAHMIRDHVLPDQIHNFAHNNEWLTRSLRHCGRFEDSVELAKNMIELPRHPLYNRLDKRGCSASWGRIRLLETLELYEQWDELALLSETMYLERSLDSADEALRAFALGKAHAHRGDDAAFERELLSLEAMLARAKSERASGLDAAEERALELEFEPADVRAAMADALGEHAGTLEDLRDKIASLKALRAVLAGEDVVPNLERLEEHGFEKSQLARLQLEAGLEAEDDELVAQAVELARAATEKADGQLVPWATLAECLWRSGAEEEALEAFDELRAYSARADLALPVFERLAPLAAARALERDWRVRVTVPEDVGRRAEVDLEALGPAYWTPPFAEDWTLPDAFGNDVSLSDWSGRPVLVILFLGFGCVHCVEQLGVFEPAAAEWREAGIDIVTIGTDTVEQLARSLGPDELDTGFAFPILADPELEVFRRYRAYDDFEDMPLHGTFLVDADGRVRWQDVSYEPFMDEDFLLAESQRLLALPVRGDEPDVARPARGPASGGAGGR